MIICKYKFDKSIYSNFIPIFNDGYNGYTVSDVTEGNIVTRTIECNILPTLMIFGENTGQYEDSKIGAKAKSLKEVLYANISSVTLANCMFGGCINLTQINTEGWNNNSLTSINHMFFCCKSLVNLDVTGLVSDRIVCIDYVFYYCSALQNITGLESWDTSNVTDMQNMFQNCFNLTSLDLSSWNTSNVTSMKHMFNGCTNLTSLDVSSFNTSNVTDMMEMFRNCQSLTTLDISNFDTSKVTDMSHMFLNCNNLTSLDVSNFDTSKVTNMSAMFYNCNNLTSLDVSNFNTSNVANMNGMFGYCKNLTSLDVSRWNTSNVTNMRSMFQNCNELTSLDLSNFDTSKVTDLCGFIDNCITLQTLNLLNIDASKASKDNMLHYIRRLNSLKTLILGDNSFYDLLNDFSSIFVLEDESSGVPLLEKLICPNADYINKLAAYLPDRSTASNPGVIVTNATISDEAMNTISGKNWSLRKMVAQYKFDANTYENLIPEFNTEFSSDMYEVNDSISEIVIDNMVWEEGAISSDSGANFNKTERVRCVGYYSILPNTTYKCVNNYFNIFWYDESKKFISWVFKDKNSLVVSPTNAKYIRVYTYRVVNNCGISAKLITRSIESVNGDLPTLMRFGSGITVNGVTTDKELALLKIFDINTSELITAKCMFQRCERLSEITNIHIGNKVTDTSFMFENCILLKTIDVSNWDTSNVIDMQFMFNAVNDMAMTLTSLDVSNWDTSNVTSMACIFGDCEFLTTLDLSNFNTSKVTDMGNMFQNCTKLTSITFGSNFNTSNVTSMSGMFYDCSNLTTLDVSNFNTSKVASMYCMFYNCAKLTTLDVSNFNTSNVKNMQSMFCNCYNLISLDVSKWDTSKVIDMQYMFRGCQNLTSLDVSNFDTSNVNNMQNMFQNCYKLTSLDVSNWDTSNVTTMYGMFVSCNNLTTIDVSNWDTSKVTDMNSMFNSCSNLTTIDVSNWDTSNVTSMYGMFHHIPKLKILQLSNWVTNQVVNMYYMFGRIDNMETLDIANWEINDNCNIENFFYNNQANKLKQIRCNISKTLELITPLLLDRTNLEQGKIITNTEVSSETLATLTSKNWTVVSDSTLTKVAEYVYDSNTWNSMIPEFNSEFVEYFIDDVEDENGLVTRTISSMGGLPTQVRFGDTSFNVDTDIKDKYNSLRVVNYINTSNCVTLANMFRGCMSLTNVNGVGCDSNIINIAYLCYHCDKLTSLDVSNWDTSNVTNMWGMFDGCTYLTSIDVSNWDTSNVTNMPAAFAYCNKLTSLDVSNWDTSKVTNMQSMFRGCYNLTSLDVSNWDTSEVTNMSNIFTNSSLLTDIGMLHCSQSTINTIATNLPTTHTQTIWVKDTKPNECTVVSGVEFKEYKENGIVVNLNSPLLDGDRIEVVDGKLCHYHKMGSVVLDGSEDWNLGRNTLNKTDRFVTKLNVKFKGTTTDADTNFIGAKSYSNNFISDNKTTYNRDEESYQLGNTNLGTIYIRINKSKLSTINVNGFKQWLSDNPTTIVCELAEPYYEDITPIQSDITLETYLECNLDIYTDLPIKTNLTYLTNIANTSSIEEDINAINEGTDLTNLLEDEINN